MQRNLLLFMLTCTVTVWMASCGRSDKTGLSVPKDASFVIDINASSLGSKLSWQELKSDEWFKNLYKDAPDSLAKQIMDDPDKMGVDRTKDICVFMAKRGVYNYFAFEGSLSNAADFETFYKKSSKDAVTKDGEISFGKPGGQTLFAWNSKRFIFIAGDADFNFARGLKLGRSSGMPRHMPADTTQALAKELMNLHGEDNLGSDGRFADLLSEPGEVHFWFNTGSYFNTMSEMFGNMLNLLKLDALFENNVGTSTLSFDNGVISIKSKHYYNKELLDIMKKYPAGNLTAETFNRIPSKDLAAVFALKFNPEGMKAITALVGVDGFLNSAFGKINYSFDEFVKANKGDLLIAVTDVAWKGAHTDTIKLPSGASYPITRGGSPDANYFLGMSVNDQPSFNKLFTNLQSAYPDEMQKASDHLHWKVGKDWFVAGNKADLVDQFISGGTNKFPFTDRITGGNIGGYIDLQKILKAFSTAAADDSTGKAILDLSLNMWQDVVIKSSGISDGTVHGECQINLMDKNTNSLKQLHQYFSKIANMAQANRHKHMRVDDIELQDIKMDTMKMPPLPPGSKPSK